MNMMFIIFKTNAHIMVLYAVIAALSYIYAIRVMNVRDFRIKIINAIFEYNDKETIDRLLSEFHLISHSKMLFSLKRLKVDNYYSKEFCEKIKIKLAITK